MVWPILTFLALAGVVAVHFWWRARLQSSQACCRNELDGLRGEQRQSHDQFVARQEALFNSMAEGVLLLDRQGRIELANRAFLTLFGVTADIRSLSIIEALRSHELAEIVAELEGANEISQKELKLSRPPERWLEVNGANILDSNGQRSSSVLVFHDLSRLKQMESARKDFVANVSHELRTPLSLIKGYVETLQDGAKDSPETATRFLEIIARNADRLQLLIEDLLVISEVESGRVNLSLQPVPLRAVTSKVMDDFRTKAAARRIELVNEVPDLFLRSDPGRLEQVLTNLLDNGIKYGYADSKIVVAAQIIEGDMAHISVEDQGPGIPAEALDRIFERFYRLDKARSRDQGGTGLGLSIVKHLVHSHGGKVWVTSRQGEGSTFHFTIPLAPEQK
jgi:two-component system, OmpR family, phosphate regulon sensor histidine kinase PhoR